MRARCLAMRTQPQPPVSDVELVELLGAAGRAWPGDVRRGQDWEAFTDWCLAHLRRPDREALAAYLAMLRTDPCGPVAAHLGLLLDGPP